MKEGQLQGGLSKHIREDSYLIDETGAGEGDLIMMVAGNNKHTVSHAHRHTDI